METSLVKMEDQADDQKEPVKVEEISDVLSRKEVVEFVEKNRDLFEHYARGRVKFSPAPEGLDTFAFDLKTNTIYINSRFYKTLGFSDEKTTFATLHEIEHFIEKKRLLTEDDGEKSFEKYLKSIEESKAYSLMDNIVSDVRENRAVVSRTSKDFGDIEKKCYREDLFKETDFTKEPKHIQFSYALIREARVPDEKCIVDEEVRQKLDALKAISSKGKANLFDVMTSPETPMSTRLKFQDKFVWPIVENLLEKDMEDDKKKKESDCQKILKKMLERFGLETMMKYREQ